MSENRLLDFIEQDMSRDLHSAVTVLQLVYDLYYTTKPEEPLWYIWGRTELALDVAMAILRRIDQELQVLSGSFEDDDYASRKYRYLGEKLNHDS